VGLNKNGNAVNARLRSGPAVAGFHGVRELTPLGPASFFLLCVVLFRFNPLDLQKHALIRKKLIDLSGLGLIRGSYMVICIRLS
jgi:hypothetical protein